MRLPENNICDWCKKEIIDDGLYPAPWYFIRLTQEQRDNYSHPWICDSCAHPKDEEINNEEPCPDLSGQGQTFGLKFTEL